MDEPTTGLHMSNIETILTIMNKLVDAQNTVIVIEHNLDIIKNADWLIDLGPEGGKNGGEIIFEGTPMDIIKSTNSLTGKYLKETIDA
jgi:excinuclease UvrABC ATPase subunit